MISLSDEQMLSTAVRTAMHTAMADVRPPAGLATAGLARGRRMRRRARALRAGGAALGLSAIIAAGVLVLGDGPEPAAPLTPPRADGPVTDEELAGILRGLLPDGGSMTVVPDDGGMPSTVRVRYVAGGGAAVIMVSLARHRSPVPPLDKLFQPCSPPQAESGTLCEDVRRRDGSVLQTIRPRFNTGENFWSAELTRPDGVQIRLEQLNSAQGEDATGPALPAPLLATSQMTAVVTSPAWKSAVARVPETEWQRGRPMPGPAGEELMAKLRRLLPAGVRVTRPETSQGRAALVFEDAEGSTMISITVQRVPEMSGLSPGCEERTGASPAGAVCTETTLSDGTVLHLRQYPSEVVGSGVTVRDATVIPPDGGLHVTARVSNGPSPENGLRTRRTPALTLEQLRGLATDPTWRS